MEIFLFIGQGATATEAVHRARAKLQELVDDKRGVTLTHLDTAMCFDPRLQAQQRYIYTILAVFEQASQGGVNGSAT